MRIMLVPIRPGGTRRSSSHKVRGGCRWRQRKVHAVPVKAAAVVDTSSAVRKGVHRLAEADNRGPDDI